MKRILTLLCLLSLGLIARSQVLFQERFNGYTLTTNSAHITNYTTINNVAIATDTNIYKGTTPLPFGKTAWKDDAWIVSKPDLSGDTVAMVAGILQGAVYTPDKWLLLPPLTIAQANTFISWETKNASATIEAYKVMLATTNVSNPTVNDFTVTLHTSNMDTNYAYNGFIRRSASLGAYNGQTVRIAFRYKNGTYPAANFCLYLDDIVVENVTTATDGAVTSVSSPRYIPKGNNTIDFTLMNKGYTAITSVEAGLSINGGSPVMSTITLSSPLAYAQSAKLNFPTQVNISNPGSANIKVFISKVNGVTSSIVTNDTGVKKQFVYDYRPNRIALIENITGAWCTACPDVSHDIQDVFKAMGPNRMLVAAIHDASTTYGDPMAIGLSQPLMSAYSGNSYPRVMFSRENQSANFPDYNYSYFLMQQAPDSSRVKKIDEGFAPVELSVTGQSYNTTTRVVNFTLGAKFVTDDSGRYNLNAYVVEDSCWGSAPGWAQYNGGNTNPNSPYYGAGSPIPNYHHKNVVLAAAEGNWGNTTLIPVQPVAGQLYSKTYTITLAQPQANTDRYNPARMRIIAFVQKGGSSLTDKYIVNAARFNMTGGGSGITNTTQVGSFDIYPNPASEAIYVKLELIESADLSLTLVNTMGQVVYKEQLKGQSSGEHDYTIPVAGVAPGVYFVQLEGKGIREIKKVVVE